MKMDETHNTGTNNEKDKLFSVEQWSEFLKASFDGHEGKVEMLLDSIIDEQDDKGQSALMIASSCGHTKVIKSLLNKGAKFDLLWTVCLNDSKSEWLH